jgi:hypothetical protein
VQGVGSSLNSSRGLAGGGDTVCKVPSQSRAGRHQTTGIRSRCTRRHAAGCSLPWLQDGPSQVKKEEGGENEDATSEGTGVVEYVHTTEAGMETFRANAKDMGGMTLTCEAGMETFRADAKDMEGLVTLTCEAGSSDAGTERRPEVPDGVTSTPGGDMGQSMDQSGKGVPKFLCDQLRVRKELVERTGTPQLIIGGVPGSNEESAPSPWQSEGLWMEIALRT